MCKNKLAGRGGACQLQAEAGESLEPGRWRFTEPRLSHCTPAGTREQDPVSKINKYINKKFSDCQGIQRVKQVLNYSVIEFSFTVLKKIPYFLEDF